MFNPYDYLLLFNTHWRFQGPPELEAAVKRAAFDGAVEAHEQVYNTPPPEPPQ